MRDHAAGAPAVTRRGARCSPRCAPAAGGWASSPTDPPAIQTRKVGALGVVAHVDAVVYASEHGSGAGKPEADAVHRDRPPARRAARRRRSSSATTRAATSSGARRRRHAAGSLRAWTRPLAPRPRARRVVDRVSPTCRPWPRRCSRRHSAAMPHEIARHLHRRPPRRRRRAAVRHRRDRHQSWRLARSRRWRSSTPPPPPARTRSSCRRSSRDELVAPRCPAPAHVERRRRCVEFFAQVRARRGGAPRRRRRARATRPPRACRRRSRDAAVDLLERVGVDAYKIASGDLDLGSADRPRRRDRQAARHVDRHGDARRSASRGGRRPRGRRRASRAAALRVGLSGAARQREPAARFARWPTHCGVPVGLSDHGDGRLRAADGRGARRVALRAASRAGRRRSTRSTARCRARPASWPPRSCRAGAPGPRSATAARSVSPPRPSTSSASRRSLCAARARCRPARSSRRGSRSRCARRPASAGRQPAVRSSAAGWLRAVAAGSRSRHARPGRHRCPSAASTPDRSATVSLNVLITAGIAPRAARPGVSARVARDRRRRGHRHRRQPAVADGLRRRSVVPGAALDRPGYIDADRRHLPRRAHRADRADDRRRAARCSPRQRDRFRRSGIRVAVSPPETDRRLQRQVRRRAAC